MDDSAGTPQHIKSDVTNMAFSTPRAVQDVTSLADSAMSRLLLLADFSITLNFVYDDATSDSVHATFKTVPSTSIARTVTLVVSGQTLANETLFTDYAYNRNADGSLTGSVPGVLANGAVPTWT